MGVKVSKNGRINIYVTRVFGSFVTYSTLFMYMLKSKIEHVDNEKVKINDIDNNNINKVLLK